MNITVLNGSPKGEISVTYQYLEFLKKKFTDIDFTVFNISQKIKLIETQKDEFDKIIDTVKGADAVLWITPVYHFSIPAQLKRFVEMIFETSSEKAFYDKYSTLITTSIHFYDHMAENYIQGISEDMGMKYIKGYLAEMGDLNDLAKQEDVYKFFEEFKRKVDNKVSVTQYFANIRHNKWTYEPENINSVDKKHAYNVIAISDINDPNSNIAKMLDTYKKLLRNPLKVINLNALNIKNGCLGCLRCGSDNECITNDDLTEIFHGEIKNADAIVFFGEIKDRYLSSNFKLFFDRSFLNGHVPPWIGKQIQYILSGPFSQTTNLREEIKARSEVGRGNLVGIVSDETKDNPELTKLLGDTANNLIHALKENLRAQSAFYEVSGHKVFRDFLYFNKAVFSADHRFYKKIKYYDFPQRNIQKRTQTALLYILLKNKKIRSEFNKRIKMGMISKSKKVVESL